MRWNKNMWLLLLIFAITLGVRLFFAFNTPDFTGDSAYFNLRQIEHITEHGVPQFDDPLSYGGRYYIFPPMFHYILAFFNLFLPISIVCKVIPNIFASLLIFVAYLIAYKMTEKYTSANFTAAISGFIPIFMGFTINSISVYSLLIPLAFLTVYCFMKLPQKKYLYLFIALAFILPLIHASALLIASGLVIYLLFLKLEELNMKRIEIEAILFLLFVMLWVDFLIFKKAFLFNGPGIIWHNIPQQLLNIGAIKWFILDVMSKVGYIPLVYGIFSIYEHIFKVKNRNIYLLISFAFSTFCLILFKLISLELGLLFLGVIMTLLFSKGFLDYFEWLGKLKWPKIRPAFVIFFFISFLINSFVPSVAFARADVTETPSIDIIEALEWAKENTFEGSTILASIDNGHLISTIAKRKNVIDSNFLLVDETTKRLEDVEIIYTSKLETEAQRHLDEYNIGYIFLSQKEKEIFNIESIGYTSDSRCFKKVFEQNNVTIFRARCSLKVK
ncbi:hypothetical protein HN419_01130 [Candidatus Woesearchaeota archaeon]|nr:hypothetical protein [Candidatus Woesearchaeota archaeon]MBT3537401.1 hypothetical protein [Candidatus Woesearchaeota archaeon]MBT4697074.1 hypothetical protein [Candidatus Woesearchaeota archaeon]MBT4717515.1 hypothetical protein [Candidatus Woesearchaeota archaeon]MBT7106289.1 hypothetical protein [Candidatus Woesearchaeota archaeon]